MPSNLRCSAATTARVSPSRNPRFPRATSTLFPPRSSLFTPPAASAEIGPRRFAMEPASRAFAGGGARGRRIAGAPRGALRRFCVRTLVRPSADCELDRRPECSGEHAFHRTRVARCGRVEERGGAAAPAIARHERAPTAIAFERLAPDAVGNVRARRTTFRGELRFAETRRGQFDFAESLWFEVRDQQVDGAFNHRAEIAVGIRVTHQVAAELELVAELGARREFHLKSNFGSLAAARAKSERPGQLAN